jgi:uncharacterized protein (DUF1684 family)
MTTASEALDLLDWKRRIFAVYEEIRSSPDPEAAWRLWREAREALYRTHPQSPLPEEQRDAYRNDCFPYDPAYRVTAEIEDGEPRPQPLPASTGGTFPFSRTGIVRFELAGRARELELHWNDVYGGGLLLVVADETSGRETYHGGRYVLDTVKGSDLGVADGRLILDFNFAYSPSCAFDPRWSCPLAPAANRLPLRLAAGERLPA